MSSLSLGGIFSFRDGDTTGNTTHEPTMGLQPVYTPSTTILWGNNGFLSFSFSI
jgi:hypothetical protein